MFRYGFLIASFLVSASCTAQTTTEPFPDHPAPLAVPPAPIATASQEPAMEVSVPALPLPTCDAGAWKQGGILFCQGEPGSIIKMNGKPVARLDEEGRGSIGIPTNAPEIATLSLPYKGGILSETLSIEPRQDEVRNLTGLDCDKVDARTPEQKDHAARAWVLKQDAFNTLHKGDGFWNGVSAPAEAPTSSPFGPVRNYTGVSKTSGETCNSTSVHRGQDFATLIGTPLLAPADGVITLADELYYEGNAIFLDHGQGLVSIFMHLSELDVKPGDLVKAGDVIGKTGNTGRTTGPHLHWAVKWQNTASEDRSGDFYIDPALLLELP